MNNKRYQEIIHEAYENYREKNHILFKDTAWTQQEFINKIKTNIEFSEKWGLKIEESELSLEERGRYAQSNHYEVSLNIKIHTGVDEDHTLHKQLDMIKIPTKLITITYKEEKIEVYEN